MCLFTTFTLEKSCTAHTWLLDFANDLWMLEKESFSFFLLIIYDEYSDLIVHGNIEELSSFCRLLFCRRHFLCCINRIVCALSAIQVFNVVLLSPFDLFTFRFAGCVHLLIETQTSTSPSSPGDARNGNESWWVLNKKTLATVGKILKSNLSKHSHSQPSISFAHFKMGPPSNHRKLSIQPYGPWYTKYTFCTSCIRASFHASLVKEHRPIHQSQQSQ